MASKSRRSSAKKSARSAKKRGSARKRGMQAGAKRSRSKVAASAKRRSTTRSRKQSPVARVKRVTREVVQQATVAVTAGVETLKDFGGNLVDRVRA
jgi:hypothetical protein